MVTAVGVRCLFHGPSTEIVSGVGLCTCIPFKRTVLVKDLIRSIIHCKMSEVQTIWGVVAHWLIRRLSSEGSRVRIPLYSRHIGTLGKSFTRIACGASA